ncbi:penicillin-binding transpeptidase domain-containing protein [Aquihabitans daechungensis]|uniref:penicillin-binding transpeptidase domain-containing protein n=1 Tax=Aquihabitans daechungensis TaxID=1052257 RepID=UPI003BA1348B
MNKRGALIGGGVVVLVGIVAAAAWFGVLSADDEPSRPGVRDGDPAAEAADAFAAAWQGGTLSKVAFVDANGDVNARSLVIAAGLGPGVAGKPAKAEVTSMRTIPPPEGRKDDPARVAATMKVTWQIDPQRAWTYDTEVELVEDAGTGDGEPAWLVDWSPAVVHKRLIDGDTLQVVRLPAARGEILGPDGKPLVGLRPVVVVGIQPGATVDRTAAAQQVAGLVGVDAAALTDRVEAGSDTDLISVVTLRQEAFEPVRAQLEAIPGVVLQEDEIPLAPTRDFARALIGTVGPATAEIARESNGRIAEGDLTGLSGVQASQDVALAGQAGVSIRVVPKPGSGREAFVLEDFPTKSGASVTITLDPEIQAAADEVMATAPKPAALVAIRPSTGDVLAVSNGPAGANGYNRALIGKYPPGSTFKIASGLTLLENGLTPETIVDCPATIVVGKEFRNAEGEVLGAVPFSKDFADSCNTAFVGQSRTITAQQLADTAKKLGYRELDLGVPVFGGSVPVTDNETEHAADMIGQGKVEASPFAVALASASVAAGRSVQPRLIIDPKNPEPEPGEQLDPEAIADLRGLMRGVVTDGTGGAVLGIPGGDVAGKTGTAEFGTQSPPQSHAWFTGFQGDIAFAVLVEDGGFGGQVAAPLAADFLTKLAEG